ncbi:MAG TPA: allantoinase AllB [bacterium]|nr:allantoinase AllB [bacterium]
MRADLAVAGGIVVLPWGEAPATVLIRDGRIAAIADLATSVAAAETIDARGRIVLPGLVDAHVHFNDPGRVDWEGVAAGSRAAAAGGVTTVVEMPLNAVPPTITADALSAKRTVFAGRCAVDYALWGGVVTDNTAELDALLDGGVVGLKAFMCDSGTEFARATDGVLLSGMRAAGRRGVPVAVHCESEELTAYLAAALRGADRRDLAAYAASRPPLAETEAVARALRLGDAAACTVYAVHLSTPEAVDLVAGARRAGRPAYAETCPHYLALDEDDLRLGPVAKCAPPLRPRALVDALWSRLLRGEVDVIASDHSPCPSAMKDVNDAWRAWGGITGVQTMLPVLIDEGVHRRGLSFGALAQLTAEAPARILGLAPHKGAITPGADADLVVVDPDREWTVTREALLSRHPHSPFLGRRLRGAVERTIVRGVTVNLDGEPVGPEGWGSEVGSATPPRNHSA